MPKEKKLERLGLKFKQKRSDLNLSIEDISVKLNINTKYLLAIEDDDYSTFPARTFAIAYYNKYANFLNILDKYPIKDEEIVIHPEAIKKFTFLNKNQAKFKSKKLNIVFVLLLLSLFILFHLNNDDDLTNAESVLQPVTKNLPTSSKEENKKELIKVDPVISNTDLELFFLGTCWVEIYTDNKKALIYKLYNKDEKLKLDVGKSFTLIVGNIDNVVAKYSGTNIDLTENANKQKVSINIIKNE